MAKHVGAILQIQKENREKREKQRRAPMIDIEVLGSVEAKGCEQLEASLIPCVRRALDEMEKRSIAFHICMEEYTPALRSSLSNLGILERAAIKFMGAKHKIALMVRLAAVVCCDCFCCRHLFAAWVQFLPFPTHERAFFALP
jgi:hypothetical protein